MQNEKWKKIAVDILAEVLGSMLIALGLYNFALEAKFPMSGFSGLAMIIYRLFGLPIGDDDPFEYTGDDSLFPGAGKKLFLKISPVYGDLFRLRGCHRAASSGLSGGPYALGALHGRAFGNRLCADLYEKFLHGRR